MKTLRDLRKESDSSKDLPTHPSHASAELPEDDKLPKEPKQGEDAKGDGQVADDQELNKTSKRTDNMKEEKSEKEHDKALPTHASDAESSQVPEDEKDLKKKPKDADKELDGEKIAAKAAGDGVAESKEEKSEKEDEEDLEESEDKEDDKEDLEESEDKEDDKEELEEEEEEEDEEDKEKMKEHINVLTSGEDLSEEFKEKASTIFEAAVNERVKATRAKLKAQFEKKVDALVEKKLDELIDNLDAYLEYSVDSWASNNELAIETGLATENTQEFIEGLKGLFEAHYIEIPEEKKDVVADKEAKIESLESELNDALNQVIEQRRVTNALLKEKELEKISEGLTDSEVEKLRTLIEKVSFESADDFGRKLKVIKESYFPNSQSQSGSGSSDVDSMIIEDGGIEEPESNNDESPAISAYVSAIDRALKN